MSDPKLFLKNKSVLITGASRGIGFAIAMRCASHGASLGLIARSPKEIEGVKHEVRGQFPNISVECEAADVSREEEILSAIHRLESKLGPTYGLVAAAGIYGSIGPMIHTPPAEWKKAIEINLLGVYQTIYSVIGGMKQRQAGRIILFSGGGQASMPNFSSYVASKGGIWRLAETLAVEFQTFGVEINAVAPGAVNTRLLDELLAAGEEKVGGDFYKRSMKQKTEGGASPEKVCHLVEYLLSERSKGLSGKILSALWDPYDEFRDLEQLTRSDLFTVRRVVREDGGTR